jgi:hypothetical protein
MRGRPYRFADLGGGVDLRVAFEDKDAPRWASALNMTSDRGPSTFTRPGSTILTSANAPSQPISLYAAEVTSPRALISVSNTTLRAISTVGASIVTGTVGASGRYEWVAAPAVGGQGPVYGLNGTDARYFNGAAFGTWTASAGTLPLGTQLAQWEGRLWIIGATASPTSLYGSDINDPRNWDTTVNALEVKLDPSDGQSLTALGVTGAYLVAFKAGKLYVVNDSTSGANRRLTDRVGCPAPRTVVGTPYGLFFLSEGGVYVTDGNDVSLVSAPVDSLLKAPGLTAASRALAAACFYNDRYWLTFVGADPTTLEYDPKLKTWWIHDLYTPQWAPWRRVDEVELMGYHDTTQQFGDNLINRYLDPSVTTDRTVSSGALTPVSSVLLSRPHSFGYPDVQKRCRAIHFDGSGSYTVDVVKDWGPSASLPLSSVQFVSGSPGSSLGRRGFSPGVARSWQVRPTCAGPMSLNSYTLYMDTKKN